MIAIVCTAVAATTLMGFAAVSTDPPDGFTACMRAHGLPDFPDSTITPDGRLAAGAGRSGGRSVRRRLPGRPGGVREQASGWHRPTRRTAAAGTAAAARGTCRRTPTRPTPGARPLIRADPDRTNGALVQ